jgi:DNA-binding response OmpR family regulator
MVSELKVMVVEDDETVLAELRDTIESAGHQVLAVTTAERALSSFLDWSPDFVVTDINLPGLGGGDFVRFAAKANGRASFILISGSQTSIETEGARPDAVHLTALVKPFRPEDLVCLFGDVRDDSGPS